MTGGILSGPAIQRAVEVGEIEIDPFEPKNINPASIDLRLGVGLTLYEDWFHDDGSISYIRSTDKIHDVRTEPRSKNYTFNKEDGIVLWPGILYLMHTEERICSTKYIPVLDGKSSIGRLGIQVHITAGYGDTGYDGQYTLEVTVVHPIRIYPGMRFCQMRFHSLVGEVLNYQKTGHYKGKTANGAVASMAHTQFQERT